MLHYKIRIDRTGNRYERLEAIEHFENGRWLCVCDCGNLALPKQFGCAKSCGCLNTELRRERARQMGLKYGHIKGQENKKYLAIYSRSSEGRAHIRKLGKLYGPIYGPLNGKKTMAAHLAVLGKQYGGKIYCSKQEQFLAAQLKKWNTLPFLWNKKTFSLGKGSRGGYYRIDFFFPKWSVALELDGVSHNFHRARDAKRDDYLLNKFKIKTVRLNNSEVYSLTRKELLRKISQ